jgi:methylated-DNA-protein-cysteine methyltransferase-like protein
MSNKSQWTPFQEAVLIIVRTIPKGYVMSYGQVAAYMGLPRGARQVGWALHSLGGMADFPWWRVINNTGKITIKGEGPDTPQAQQELLECDGVSVSSDFVVDMRKYRALPLLEGIGIEPEYVEKVNERYMD